MPTIPTLRLEVYQWGYFGLFDESEPSFGGKHLVMWSFFVLQSNDQAIDQQLFPLKEHQWASERLLLEVCHDQRVARYPEAKLAKPPNSHVCSCMAPCYFPNRTASIWIVSGAYSNVYM